MQNVLKYIKLFLHYIIILFCIEIYGSLLSKFIKFVLIL